jgi:hypothetical protein
LGWDGVLGMDAMKDERAGLRIGWRFGIDYIG